MATGVYLSSHKKKKRTALLLCIFLQECSEVTISMWEDV